jgi:predicted AlkP superfamily phosphohydrolase/phosphomutase
MWESGRDLVLVLAWTVILFGLDGFVLGMLSGIICRLRRCGTGATVFLTITVIASVFAFVERFGRCYPCHQFLDWRHPHLIFTPSKSLLMTAGIGLLSVAIGVAMGGIAYAIWHTWQRRSARTAFWAAVAITAAAVAAASYLATPRMDRAGAGREIPEPKGGTPRLLLIVDEALTWDVADDLIKKGKLPTLGRLAEAGVRGNLATIQPCLSHPLWATLATSRRPVDHGIGSKISFAYPGMKRGIAFYDVPVNMMLMEIFIKLGGLGFGGPRELGTAQRRAKALWNMAGECGVEVGVVGWRITWPAEKVNGFMVSSRLYEDNPRNHVYPASLEGRIARAIESEPAPQAQDFIPCPLDEAAGDPKAAPRVDALERILSIDHRRHLVAQELVKIHDPDLMTLGFYSLDGISHVFFWEHSMLSQPDTYPLDSYTSKFTSPELVECLGPVLSNVYAFHDSLIGTWLDWVGDEGSIIIASDHGFEMNGSNHYYAPPGVLICYGPPFKQGVAIEGATIYDVTPTVLYLLGLPVPEDLEGRVLKEAMDPDWLSSNPVRTIPTYE